MRWASRTTSRHGPSTWTRASSTRRERRTRCSAGPRRPRTVDFVGQVCLKQVRDVIRVLREDILEDGRVDLAEAELLLRIAEPYAKAGNAKVVRLVGYLRKMLADGVISDEESRRIARVLKLI